MPTDQTQPGEAPASPSSPHAARWLTKGVWGIGLASFLADVGHEVPTALFASFVTITLGAPVVVLGLIEGLAVGLPGLARFAGGPFADAPFPRLTRALRGAFLPARVPAPIWQAF